MNTTEEEISIAQQDLRQLSARLSNFLNHYWQVWEKATPTQIAAHNAAKVAIDEAVAKLELLKEAMR
ncbi:MULTISPECIES: hypothetical protein [unclassified Microcoleus]|uniref:hypothetical protein n=1 Tax=unclassified Microcoleus TaxID=2642155 RepID=UPI002FD552FE